MNQNERFPESDGPASDDDVGSPDTLPTKDLPTGEPTNNPNPGGDIDPGQPEVGGGGNTGTAAAINQS